MLIQINIFLKNKADMLRVVVNVAMVTNVAVC